MDGKGRVTEWLSHMTSGSLIPPSVRETRRHLLCGPVGGNSSGTVTLEGALAILVCEGLGSPPPPPVEDMAAP